MTSVSDDYIRCLTSCFDESHCAGQNRRIDKRAGISVCNELVCNDWKTGWIYEPQWRRVLRRKKEKLDAIKNWAQHCVSTKRLATLATSSAHFLVKDNFRYLPNWTLSRSVLTLAVVPNSVKINGDQRITFSFSRFASLFFFLSVFKQGVWQSLTWSPRAIFFVFKKVVWLKSEVKIWQVFRTITFVV